MVVGRKDAEGWSFHSDYFLVAHEQTTAQSLAVRITAALALLAFF